MSKRDYAEEFIHIVKKHVRYWNLQKDMTELEKLEALACSILSTLDGVTCENINIDKIARDCKSMMLHESFYDT